MLARLLKGLCFLTMAATAATAGAADPPAPIHRIVAVGDLHGDYSAWMDIARAARLVDGKGHWAGGDTVFVQTGDVVDRGPDSLRIIEHLMQLQREAPRSGGKVVTLVGNHEAMNMTDDLRYVSPGEYAAYADGNSGVLRERFYTASKAAIEAVYRKNDPAMTSDAIRQAWLAATPLGQIEHQLAWQPDGRIGRWIASHPAVVLLGGTLFVHGGISTAYAQLPIDEINARVDAALKARDATPAAIINDENGPLWYRGYFPLAPDPAAPPSPAAPLPAGASPRTIAQEIDLVLQAYGAQRIVVAHTPILTGIMPRDDGKLIPIDTGISSYYGGTPSYLEILDGMVIPHAVARSAVLQKGVG